jgi:phospholipid/cholesterol/gamma-HCH transport system substrate-binding protein
MRESLFETLVGIVVVAVAAIFLFFSLQQRSDAATGDSYPLVARFDRADGIEPGTDVRVAGVKVGTVTAKTLNPKDYVAEVTVAIKKGIDIPVESSARIQSDSLLGGSYIHIQISGMTENMAPGSKFDSTQGSKDIIGLLLDAVSGMGGDAGGGAGAETPP